MDRQAEMDGAMNRASRDWPAECEHLRKRVATLTAELAALKRRINDGALRGAKFKPGDRIRMIGQPDRTFLVTENYHGGPMVDCVQMLEHGTGSGFSPFATDLELVPAPESPKGG